MKPLPKSIFRLVDEEGAPGSLLCILPFLSPPSVSRLCVPALLSVTVLGGELGEGASLGG